MASGVKTLYGLGTPGLDGDRGRVRGPEAGDVLRGLWDVRAGRLFSLAQPAARWPQYISASPALLPPSEHGPGPKPRWPHVAAPAVLLDVLSYRIKKGQASAAAISLDELLDIAEDQGVLIERHDAVVIRMGGGESSHWQIAGEDFARWVLEQEMEVIGTDGSGVVMPPSWPPLPLTLLAPLWLEDLAEYCGHTGQYRWFLVACPLVNDQGSYIVHPLAMM